MEFSKKLLDSKLFSNFLKNQHKNVNFPLNGTPQNSSSIIWRFDRHKTLQVPNTLLIFLLQKSDKKYRKYCHVHTDLLDQGETI